MIELKSISKTYKTGIVAFQALKKIDLKIEPGEFIAIMGPSGSGKSTLLHILGFLDTPDNGSYRFLQEDVSKLEEDQLALIRNKLAGFVFQQFYLLPGIKAKENVGLPKMYAGKSKIESDEIEKLAAVGLKHRSEHVPNELSGGERQRVAIARSLINNPMLIFADEPTGNLDTQSETEIMRIFSDLNEQGITIIMVTHEQEIAEYAKRIILMRDGKIVSDKKTRNSEKANKLVQNLFFNINQSQTGVNRIDIGVHIKQAWRAMMVNKMRTFLSMLGVLIGIAAVVTMLALGSGATQAIKQDLSRLGSNLLIVRQASRKTGGVSLGTSSYARITRNDATIIKNLNTVKYVSGMVSGRAQVIFGNRNWNTTIQGVEPSYEFIRSYIPETGRFFNEEECKKREKVALIGHTIYKELFNSENPIGKKIKLNKVNFRIIGILPEKGYSRGRDNDDMVIVPLSAAMYRLFGKNYLDRIEVEAKSENDIEKAQADIKELINRTHNIRDGDEFIDIRDLSEIQEAITSTVTTISTLLGVVAVISLLVGGIGIMNIMLVSVTERTREIGIRKAIGACGNDILFQFLIEAVVLTLTGGFLGLFLSIIVTKVISFFTGWTMIVTFFSVAVSTGFSVAVGIFFGLLPAKKASQLKTIDALRYE